MSLNPIKLFRGDPADELVESFSGFTDFQAGGGGSGVQVVQSLLTADEILALVETPVVLVPGSVVPGFVNVVIAAAFTYVAGATPYTVGVNSTLQLGNGYDRFLDVPMEGLLDQAVSQFYSSVASFGGSFPSSEIVPLADIDGVDITLTCSNDPTDGDGVMTVTVAYFGTSHPGP